MTRNKVNLAYIANDADRRTSYNKRKNSLLKKVEEISTLCEVEACAIVYGENEAEPEVWPSREETQEILEKFQTLPEYDRTRKMVNQEGFSQQCIEKSKVQYQRLQRENKRKEMLLSMYQVISGSATVQDLDMSNAGELDSVVQEVRRDIKARVEARLGNGVQANIAPNNTYPDIN